MGIDAAPGGSQKLCDCPLLPLQSMGGGQRRGKLARMLQRRGNLEFFWQEPRVCARAIFLLGRNLLHAICFFVASRNSAVEFSDSTMRDRAGIATLRTRGCVD